MHKRFQGLWVSLGVLALPPGLLATYLRVFPPTDDVPAMFASFIPFGLLAYAAGLLFFVIALVRAQSKRALGVLSVLTVALLALHLSWMVPMYVADHRPATTDTITVMSLNMLNGMADAAQVTAQAKNADVVVLLEYTPSAAQRLREQGWDELFGYSIGDPRNGVSGSAIYSKYPLADKASLGTSSFQQWRATADLPEIGAVTIIAAHPCNPLCGNGAWAREHALLQTTAKPYLDKKLIMAGDFNAIDDHGPMRQLAAAGLESAADIVGAGWMPTFSAQGKVPPAIGIDHLLLSQQLTATSIETFKVTGTDHLGLTTTIAGTS